MGSVRARRCGERCCHARRTHRAGRDGPSVTAMLRKFSPTIIAASGLGAVLIAVFALGRLLGWSTTVQVAIIAVLLVVAVILLVVKLVRADRHAKGIEKAMFAQSSKQQQTARPDRQGEIRQLQEQFDRALKTLKDSKL